MASIFKNFLSNDIVSTRTLLRESIPITGSIPSGTYAASGNIKYFSHGLFEAVYDYPYLSASSNHIFDLSVGYASSSVLSSSTAIQNRQKINMYNEMAKILVGTDVTGTILPFDQTGSLLATGTKMKECIFIQLARLITKDEIKKGSFSLALGVFDTYSSTDPFASILTITDAGGANNFKVNSPAGEFGILSASAGGAYSSSYGATVLNGNVGLIYYQAGIVVLTGSVFLSTTSSNGILRLDATMDTNNNNFPAVLTGSSITGTCDAFRHRIQNLSFNNTTELNSTIYFCRLNNNDFNYSSNPTYLSSSQLVVKNSTLDAPVSYLTTVGLYSSDNELLAVAKLSEPLKKSPDTELNLRLRLDFIFPWFIAAGTAMYSLYNYLHPYTSILF